MLESDLNPEAPEFHPYPDVEMAATIEEGYKYMKEAIRTSNTFPVGASYDQFKTFTEFNVVMSTIRNNVICQCTHITVRESPAAKLSSDDNESNSERVVDANDGILDRINVHLDTVSGENRASAAVQPRAVQPAAWNRQPVVATLQVRGGSASLIGAKNVPRPQLAFKEPVDNSESLFVPRIREKPNGTDPLRLTLVYDEAGEAIGYEHPYQAELQRHAPPPWALLAPPEPPERPRPPQDSPLTLVHSLPQLRELVHHLTTVRELAVDLEHHSYRTYQGITCLIQISTDEGGDFIVDALSLRDELHALNQSFTDPTKVKVFHGAEQDVQWLQRDFGVYVVGMFDTHQAARVLGLEGRSLKYLLHKYCQIEADKTHQLADWRMRPLPDELVQYARCDTHYLLYVARRMRLELLALQEAALLQAFQMSDRVALTTYVKPVVRADSHMALYVRSRKWFGRAQLAAMRALWAWRDRHARALDESATYLLPNHLLLALAEALPRDVQGLRALADPTPPFLNQHLHALHLILLQCRDIPEEPQALGVPAGVLTMWRTPRDPLHSPHDVAHTLTSWEESDMEQALAAVASARYVSPPDVQAFSAQWLTPPASPVTTCLPDGKTSQLNADAKTFLPPHERYQMYRGFLMEVEHVDALRDYETKLDALCESAVEEADSRRPRTSHAPDAGPSTAHASDAGPSTAHASDAGPSTAHASDAGPSTANAPDARPSTSNASDARPSTANAPDARPSTSNASDARPSTSNASDARPSTTQLKRKRHEKLDPKKATEIESDKPVHIFNKHVGKGKPLEPSDVKAQYKTANYNKFHQPGDKGRKQPKRK